jgi:protein-S-isoprenylcysteine O-methyltransferase Ste14
VWALFASEAEALPDSQRDVPGVVVFPPLVPLTVLVVGGLLDWLLPFGLLDRMPFGLRVGPGAALFLIGLALAIAGERAFHGVGTNVNPMRPALALAERGVYAHLRNPMYAGMGFALFGIVLAFALEWTFVLTFVGLAVLHYGVVLREERYLERKFGADYRRYKASVPRYGWRL